MPDISEVFADSTETQAAPAVPATPVAAPITEAPKGDYDYTELDQLDARMQADKQEKYEASKPKGEVTDSAVTDDATGEKPHSDDAGAADPQIDDELLAYAEAWGISREAATKLGEVELAKEINRMWARYAVANAQKEAHQEPTESDALKSEIDAMKADPEGYDEKIIKVMESTYQRLLKMEHRDRERYEVDARRQYESRMVAEQHETEAWDKLINEVEMPDVFGKGMYGKEITEKSREFQNRAQVVRAAVKLRDVFPRESDRDLLIRATRAAFGDRFETKAQQNLAEQVSKRASQILPRPRTTKAQSPQSDFEKFKAKYDQIIGPSQQAQTVDEIFA